MTNRRLLLAATVCALAACDGWGTGLGRRAGTPEVIGQFPPITIGVSTGVAVAPLFIDPTGDALTLTVEVEAHPPTALAARVSGGFVELRPAAPVGLAHVLVAATDPSDRKADLMLRVKVRVPPIPNPDEFGIPRPSGQPRAGPSLPSRQLLLGELAAIPLSRLFSVPSSAKFSATSSSGAVQASIAGDSLVLEARSLGPAQIVVTASNDVVASTHPVHQIFDIVVRPPGTPPNEPPRWRQGVPARIIPVGFRVPYGVSEYFSDPEGGPLTFSATSDEPHRIPVTVSGNNVILEGKSQGDAVITLVATDHGGLPVRARMQVSAVTLLDDR